MPQQAGIYPHGPFILKYDLTLNAVKYILQDVAVERTL